MRTLKALPKLSAVNNEKLFEIAQGDGEECATERRSGKNRPKDVKTVNRMFRVRSVSFLTLISKDGNVAVTKKRI